MWLNTKNADKQLCKFWERKKKNVSATYCCKACMESSCDECKALHELVAILQSHKIVQIVDTQREGDRCVLRFVLLYLPC